MAMWPPRNALSARLLDAAWDARQSFTFQTEPLADSVARAKALDGPVVMLDHCDNSSSGGTMDTTTVLAEIMRQGLEDVVFFGIYDPDAVQAAMRAGVGATVELSIGGRMANAVDPRQQRAIAGARHVCALCRPGISSAKARCGAA